MSQASGVPDACQRNSNTLSDLLRAIPVKVSLNDGKICNQTTGRKRLERFGEV